MIPNLILKVIDTSKKCYGERLGVIDTSKKVSVIYGREGSEAIKNKGRSDIFDVLIRFNISKVSIPSREKVRKGSH